MGGNNKKKSSSEMQCDGYSRCIKMCFLSIKAYLPEQNSSQRRHVTLEICPIQRGNRLFIGRIVQNMSDRTFYAIF